jgi:streptogramin lyase
MRPPMPSPRPKRLAAVLAPVLVLALSLLAAGSASAAPHLDGTFEVPGISANNRIVAGPDGNMWVTVSNGEKDVARITPAGQVEEFELGAVTEARGIAVDPTVAGKMWVTTSKGVASFLVADPKNSAAETDLGLAGAEAIVAGPDGQMWVAATEKVVHFAPATPKETKTLPVAGLAPKDIDVAGSLIVVADGNNEKKRVVTFTTADVEKAFEIPGGSQGLAGAPSGQIAFSAPLAEPEQSGLITPPGPAQSFDLTGDPFGVALGVDNAFWIVQFSTGVLERLTLQGAHAPGVSGLPKESARQIAAGPGNTLWVTLDKKEGVIEPSVAKISGLEPAVGGGKAPNTTLAKGPKVFRTHRKTAKVTFRFKSSVKGAKFECALTKVRKGKKQPKARFKACKSPRTYHLRPGKYRFAVRAVANGLTDKTPASRTIRVLRVPRHR